MNFSIDIPPIRDKNPVKTIHIIIKRPQASWSQSVFSVPVGDFSEKIIPNRDYPYEGLSVLIDGENFHFLDGIAVGVKKGRDYVELSAKNVNITPWQMSYLYENEAERLNLTARYYLMDMGTGQNGVTACVSLECNASSLVIEPLVDIRHMYEDSMPDEHCCRTLRDGMLIWRGEKCMALRTAHDCEVRTWKKELSWWYKLGSGFREKTEDNAVFLGEPKKPVSLGELEIPMDKNSSALLAISCSNAETKLEELNDWGREWLLDKTEEEKRAEKIVTSLGIDLKDPAITFRALALSKFGMYVDGEFFYEAGDFWFRTPWFRDLFEGILNNIETFVRIGDADKIKTILRHAFDYQDEYGRIPNRFPERRLEKLDYNNADATFLAFIAAGEFLKRNWDADLATLLCERAEYTISRMTTNDMNMLNGAPVLHENGLVSVVPRHTWTDSSRIIEINGKRIKVSVRIPDSWCKDLKDENEVNKPVYLLPEINAQWIKMLRHCVDISMKIGYKEIFSQFVTKAKKTFKEVFWDARDYWLYNLVTLDGRRDKTQGSPAVVAFALLLDEDLFSHKEVEHFVEGVKTNLLVERGGHPFGILVKKSAKRTYYGDEEYHEAMVWPRDTPYLINILRYATDTETVHDILQSTLDHQMNEGFVFYNSELFSPDNGEMIPVKNPIQFWSQWVDPFL
jgi:hypothetical protein